MSSAVAVYYGVEIPEVLLAAEMQNHSAKSLGEARAQAGRALAAKAVLLATARELELKAQPEKNTHGQEETIEEALVRAVLSEEIDVEAPSDADLRVIYDRNPEGFTTPPLLEASHILLAPKEESDTALSAAR